MLTKICLLFLGLKAVECAAVAAAIPNSNASYFNFTHISEDGGFYASYNSKDKQVQYREFDDDKSDKIYGGSYAALGQFPFMVIVHRLAENGRYYVCGGSILSKRWVLTAGHCVVDYPRKFFVAFGIIDKTGFGYDSIKGLDGVSMIVTQGAVHPQYGLGRNDIGLLYMPKDIPFGDTIQPIRIAGRSYVNQSFVNKMGNIYGWGKDRKGGNSVPRLMYGRVPVVSLTECRKTWSVDQTQVCTDSSTGQDVCQGDSGGPLVVMEDDDEPLQIGIVSYGDAGCPSSRPDVFTRVSAYLPWIKKVTGIDYE